MQRVIRNGESNSQRLAKTRGESKRHRCHLHARLPNGSGHHVGLREDRSYAQRHLRRVLRRSNCNKNSGNDRLIPFLGHWSRLLWIAIDEISNCRMPTLLPWSLLTQQSEAVRRYPWSPRWTPPSRAVPRSRTSSSTTGKRQIVRNFNRTNTTWLKWWSWNPSSVHRQTGMLRTSCSSCTLLEALGNPRDWYTALLGTWRTLVLLKRYELDCLLRKMKYVLYHLFCSWSLTISPVTFSAVWPISDGSLVTRTSCMVHCVTVEPRSYSKARQHTQILDGIGRQWPDWKSTSFTGLPPP